MYKMVREDRHMSIRMIAEIVTADKETDRKISHVELNMTKVCAKLVPRAVAVALRLPALH